VAKMKEETRAQLRMMARHPILWTKGTGLPEEKIRPWEGMLQFFGEALKGFMTGFSEMKDRLYKGMGEGMIPPNWISVSSVITTLWDGLNDPVIGVYMDRKRYGVNVHRNVMRFNATYSPINILLQCFSFGFTPFQRIVLWTALGVLGSVVSTANAVSESKIWAGITPHSKERGVVQLWKTLGNQLSQGAGALPVAVMGMTEMLGITNYQIMTVGALIFALPAIFARWLPSYAKQRVDFNFTEDGEEAPPPPTLRESLAAVKHNPWFIMSTAISFITVLAPKADQLWLYRFLLKPMKIGKNEYGGEIIFSIKNSLCAIPGTILQPFALQFFKRFGGELNLMRAKAAVELATCLARYFVGYNTAPKLMFMFFMEIALDIFKRWNTIADKQVQFLMLDYVEWKTGLRTEGMNTAVSGFLSKLISSNVGTVFGNMVTQWTGFLGYDFPRAEQPERFIKSIWPLMYVNGAISGAAWLAGLLWFKFPVDRAKMEADLIERREVEKTRQEEAEV